jgi:hypothetical protein
MTPQSDKGLKVWKSQLKTHDIPKFMHFTPYEQTFKIYVWKSLISTPTWKKLE